MDIMLYKDDYVNLLIYLFIILRRAKKKADRGVLHPLRINLLIVTSLRCWSHLCVALILKKRCKYMKYLFMLQVFFALFFVLRQDDI